MKSYWASPDFSISVASSLKIIRRNGRAVCVFSPFSTPVSSSRFSNISPEDRDPISMTVRMPGMDRWSFTSGIRDTTDAIPHFPPVMQQSLGVSLPLLPNNTATSESSHTSAIQLQRFAVFRESQKMSIGLQTPFSVQSSVMLWGNTSYENRITVPHWHQSSRTMPWCYNGHTLFKIFFNYSGSKFYVPSSRFEVMKNSEPRTQNLLT